MTTFVRLHGLQYDTIPVQKGDIVVINKDMITSIVRSEAHVGCFIYGTSNHCYSVFESLEEVMRILESTP